MPKMGKSGEGAMYKHITVTNFQCGSILVRHILHSPSAITSPTPENIFCTALL